jgi:hypothetical protein
MRGTFLDTADDGQLYHRGAGRAADVSSEGGGDDEDVNEAEAERIRLEIDRLQMKLQGMQDNYLKTTGVKFDPVSGKREEGRRGKARQEIRPQVIPLGTWMFLGFCGLLLISAGELPKPKVLPGKPPSHAFPRTFADSAEFWLAVAMQIMSFYKVDFGGSVSDFFGLDLERAKR